MGKVTKKITSLSLSALKPGKDNGEVVIDTGVRGQGALIMRVTDHARIFYYRYFLAGRRRFELVGYFDPEGADRWRDPTDGDAGTKGGKLSLAAAKEGYHAMSRLAQSVGDLRVYFEAQAEKAEAARRAAEIEARVGTFADLIDSYIAALKNARKVSAADVEATLTRNVTKPFPGIVALQARAVTPDHIQEILARLVGKGSRRQVNLVRSYLHAAFQHAGRGHDFDPRRLAEDRVAFRLTSNPVALIPRIAEFDTMGTVVLSADEVRAYWRLLDTVPSAMTRAFLKLHLLTGGQRPRQLLDAPWTAYGASVVALVDKKGRAAAREHLVPLLPEALAVLEDVKVLSGGFAAPFMSKKDKLLRLETIAKAVAQISNAKKDGEPVFRQPFTIRDIRRTVETRLVDLGVSKETRSHLLSHDRGGKIDQTYNRNSYLTQKTTALRAWVDFVMAKAEGEGNVTSLRGKKQS